MAVSNWTTRIEAVVRADVMATYGWWSEPARRLEERSFYEDLSKQNKLKAFSWVDVSDRGLDISEGRWLSPNGLEILFTSTRPQRADSPETDVDGNPVLRLKIHQRRRFPNGRVEETQSETVLTFLRESEESTIVRVVTYQHKSGVKWWERFLPPIDQRAHRRMRLREAASRCETQLANRR